MTYLKSNLLSITKPIGNCILFLLRTVWSYLVDLLLALQHLHSNDLIHMDVKPENIFIGRDGICKLGDFGLVVDLSKDSPTKVSSQEGTIGGDSKYMASEILEGVYTKACDVFSLGQ